MTHIYAVYKRPTSEQKIYTGWIKLKWWKNISNKWAWKKKAGVAILVSNKIDFKTKTIIRDKGHYIILKGIIHQGDLTLINIYAPIIGTPKYIRKTLENFKKDINSNSPEVGDFNTPLSKMNRSSKQRINKDIVVLNNILDQRDLIYIYRTFHPEEAKYTFFSNAHVRFSKIDHMIAHKTSLNRSQKIEIIFSIFSDHNSLKLETNLKETLKNIQIHGDWITYY